MRSPVAARAAGHSISRMEALSFRIKRDWRRDRSAPFRAEMKGADRFADAQPSVFDEAKRDRAAEGGAEIARRHIALRSPRAARARCDMGAGRQRRLVRRHAQANQLLAARLLGDWHEQRALTDVFILPRVARAGDAEVMRQGRPVGVLADDDETLLR